MLAPAELGALRASQTLMGPLNVSFQFLESYHPKRYAHVFQSSGHKALQRHLIKNLVLGLGMGILFLGTMAGLSKPLLNLVFGSSFGPYYPVLVAFCGLYMLILAGYPLRFAGRAIHKNAASFWAYAGTAIIGLTAAPELVQHFGLMGVVAGLYIGQLMQIAVNGTSLYFNLKD